MIHRFWKLMFATGSRPVEEDILPEEYEEQAVGLSLPPFMVGKTGRFNFANEQLPA